MKKNKILTIIIVLLIIVFLIIYLISTLYLVYSYKINQKIKLNKVPYINQEILPNQKIYSDMISYKNIRKFDMPKDIYTDIENIIGKCIKEDEVIKEGDFVYKDKLKECEYE